MNLLNKTKNIIADYAEWLIDFRQEKKTPGWDLECPLMDLLKWVAPMRRYLLIPKGKKELISNGYFNIVGDFGVLGKKDVKMGYDVWSMWNSHNYLVEIYGDTMSALKGRESHMAYLAPLYGYLDPGDSVPLPETKVIHARQYAMNEHVSKYVWKDLLPHVIEKATFQLQRMIKQDMIEQGAFDNIGGYTYIEYNEQIN